MGPAALIYIELPHAAGHVNPDQLSCHRKCAGSCEHPASTGNLFLLLIRLQRILSRPDSSSSLPLCHARGVMEKSPRIP